MYLLGSVYGTFIDSYILWVILFCSILFAIVDIVGI